MSAYEKQRAVVIGGLGFIGAHLVDRLQQQRADVTIVTPSVSRHAAAAARFAARGVRLVEGDLRDASAMRCSVDGAGIVFNLAGQSGAVQSMEDPFTDLDVNLRGNLVLLEALRAANPRAKLVFVSSRLTYGRAGCGAIAEDHPVDPGCTHAIHKVAVERYLQLYGQVYGLTYTIARLTNPYGPGQPRERTAYGVVNRMIHLALAGETLRVYGDGSQQRDYIYIDDAADALLALGASDAANGNIYNVGSGSGISFADMARTVAGVAGGGCVESVPWPELAERVETGDFVADISRIRRDTGWQPRVALADGLERTVAFHRAHAL